MSVVFSLDAARISRTWACKVKAHDVWRPSMKCFSRIINTIIPPFHFITHLFPSPSSPSNPQEPVVATITDDDQEGQRWRRRRRRTLTHLQSASADFRSSVSSASLGSSVSQPLDSRSARLLFL